MRSFKKQWFVNLVLLSAGTFLGLLLVEGALRNLKPPQVSVTHAPCIYLRDEQFGYRFKPQATDRMSKNFEIDNIIEINAIGFHDIEHKPNKNTEGLRILAIGDSFTSALEVDKLAGWTQTLQRKLREMGYPSAEVINLGLDGTGTDVHLAILKEYMPIFQPDLVILAFYKNDPGDVLDKRAFRECYKGYTLAYFNEDQGSKLRAFVDRARKPGASFFWLFDNFYLFRLILFSLGQDIFWQHNFQTPFRNYHTPSMIGLTSDKKADNPADMDDVFKEFMALSRQHNFRLLVIPVPANDSWNKPADSMEALQQNVSKSVLAQIDIVDVLPGVQALLAKDNKAYHELFWKYDEHLNAYGNQIFGLAVAQEVDRYVKNSPIELHVQSAGAGLWTVVQWQDRNGDWHDVEAWQGALDVGGKIRWWVSAKDFNTGPFRWVVFDEAGKQPLAVSSSFNLPGASETVQVEVSLEP